MTKRYKVLGIIGEGNLHEGSYGVVMKCRNNTTGEIVAIKKFKDFEDNKSIYIKELNLLKVLRNKNIVQIKENFCRKGKLHLVFEYVGKNLLNFLEENPSGLDPLKIKSIIFQLCTAIEFCHRNEIIHRDLKPENILISSSDVLKLCDFSQARLVVNSTHDLTNYVASRWYRSPEILLGSRAYGKSIDMWALGCIMGELIDGQPIFPGESDINQLVLIQMLLGPITFIDRKKFQKKHKCVDLKIPKISQCKTLDQRYTNLDKKALNFIERLLKIDPDERMTSYEALRHPYLSDFLEISLNPCQMISFKDYEDLLLNDTFYKRI